MRGSRLSLWELWVHLSMLLIDATALYLLFAKPHFGAFFGAVCLGLFAASQPLYFLLGHDSLNTKTILASVLAIAGALLLFQRYTTVERND